MTTDLEFDGTLTCALECADIDRAIAWYRDVLGFELIYKLDELAWCEFRTPVEGVVVGLSQAEEPEVRGGATLTFGVRDIDAARRALEGREVPFDGDTVTIEGMVRLATFYDPDGNKLMLAQILQEG